MNAGKKGASHASTFGGKNGRVGRPLSGKRIAQLVQLACVRDVCASKPGNVSRYYDFQDTTLEDFILSAVVIGPVFENIANASIGQTVLQAVQSTRSWVCSNTNLGMILLLAPLAKAALGDASDYGTIRRRLSVVLNSLTVEDARLTYEAIRLAHPAGMGRLLQADVSEEPSITLLEAMALANERDAVAREYVTDYAITFEVGLPALRDALAHGGDFSSSVVQTFLKILSHVPDTLIARKKGMETAAQVSRKADEVLAQGGVFTPDGQAGLDQMRQSLCDPDHSMNPGTTADLTTAAIFLMLLELESKPFSL
jgi:triphosphoribosyl-dephospho-CoA synthase